MEECVDLADNVPDGVMFPGLDGRLYKRTEILTHCLGERRTDVRTPTESGRSRAFLSPDN